MKDLNYYKNKASESYAETTLEVLTYIEKLENKLEKAINYSQCCNTFYCGVEDRNEFEKCEVQCGGCQYKESKKKQ